MTHSAKNVKAPQPISACSRPPLDVLIFQGAALNSVPNNEITSFPSKEQESYRPRRVTRTNAFRSKEVVKFLRRMSGFAPCFS